ncbi:MAG: winged helix DNA-binding domain-containing protein [Chitinophagaceae bacterium]|nr:MAG: winged helix DNA-binding domain-containing protein [Chitinophagaceae bacterium]
MTHQEISIMRMHNQHLTSGRFQTAAQLVQHFGAVQGQEYEQTKWGLGIRLPHLNNVEIDLEITSGKIRRTHLMRPTWHLVHADDILWMQALTSERVQAINRSMYKQLELTDIILNRSVKIIRQSLEKSGPATRAELAEILKSHRVNTEGLRLVYIMMNAELKSIICSGPRKGKQHTYELLNNPKEGNLTLKPADKEEGLLKLAQRYFESRGPATVKDFSTWSGLTIADCQKGINLNGTMLENFIFEGETYYLLPVANISNRNNMAQLVSQTKNNELFLLPVYDEMIMGYKNRKSIMQNKTNQQRYKYDCMILYKGQVVGTYKRTIKQKTALFAFDYFHVPDNKLKAHIRKILKHFESFTGLQVVMADADYHGD